MKLSRIVLAVILGVCATLTLPRVHERVQAQVGLILSTSFDCPEWTQTATSGNPCGIADPVERGGDWTGPSGRTDQITLAANNPLGTGRGFRHWREAGTNQGGGGVRILFPNTTQIWMRFYMRYSAGFAWENGHPHYVKDINWNVGLSNFKITGYSNGFFYHYNVNQSPYAHYSADSWDTINGGATGDGKFHCFETYIKMDTNGSNGEAKLWRDGKLVLTKTGLDHGGGILSNFLLGSNQSRVLGNGHYTDYDDVAISYTGYIGPLGGSGAPQPTGPLAPTNLRISN
jgi:hypothetical protein